MMASDRGDGRPFEGSGSQFNVVWIARTLRKRFLMVLVITLAVSLAITFHTLGETKIFESSAVLLFDPTPPRPLGREVDTVVDMGSGNYWNNKEYYETQYALMRSTPLALSVVEELSLASDLRFLQNVAPGRAPKDAPPATPSQAATILLSRLSVSPIKNSRLAKLTYQDSDPNRAQLITGAIATTFVRINLERAQASTNSAVEWLNGQLDNLRNGLNSSELALHNYKQEKNILSVDPDAQSNMLREEMQQLSSALTAARVRQKALAARHAQLAQVGTDNPLELPASELLQSSVLQHLRTEYVQAVRTHEALLASDKGANHPEVKAARASMDAAQKALVGEVRNVQGAVKRELDTIQMEEGGIAGLLKNAKSQALNLNLLAIEYNRLLRTKQNSEKLYELVLERSKEGDLTRMLQVNNIRVAEEASLPTTPVRPRVPLNIMLGLLAGLVLGVGGAIGREALDRTVKTQEDLEQSLHLTYLGLLPAVTDSQRPAYSVATPKAGTPAPSADRIVHESPLSGPAEAARSIRTNIQFMSPDRPFRTLLVTSAGMSEGKTTIASNLAISLAQAGHSVLLIDCDLRRPRVHRIYAKSNDLGVTTVLMQPDTFTESLVSTDIPNLHVLPAGIIPPNPSELLQSKKFHALLDSFKERYDRVVIDSPPVVPVTDAAILSTIVDATVIVVRAFRTNREVVAHGVRSILSVGGTIAGAVLNAVDLNRSEYRRYYRYAYYGKGYKAETPPAPTKDAE